MKVKGRSIHSNRPVAGGGGRSPPGAKRSTFPVDCSSSKFDYKLTSSITVLLIKAPLANVETFRIMLFISLSVCLSVCPSVVCLFVAPNAYPENAIFSKTKQFRDIWSVLTTNKNPTWALQRTFLDP